MGEGAPSMSLGSSPATLTRNSTKPHVILVPLTRLADVDKAGEDRGLFRGLPVEENVDSISSTGPPSLSQRLSTELQICDSKLPPTKNGFYTEFTPVMKEIIFKKP